MGTGKILIGYPHGGSVKTPFHESMLRFQRHDFFHDYILEGGLSAGGCLVEDNREAICQGFLEYKTANRHGGAPEWLVTLDTDIGFAPETIYGLLDAADPIERPIVSGLYYTTMDGGFAVVWLRKHPADNDYKTLTEVNLGLNPIDACGMGICIIHRSVLEKMAVKYAEQSFKWFGRDSVQLMKSGWTRLGEDVTFCARAQSLGFKIWGHSELRVDHYKERKENHDTMGERIEALRYRDLMKQAEARDAEELRKAAVEQFYRPASDDIEADDPIEVKPSPVVYINGQGAGRGV